MATCLFVEKVKLFLDKGGFLGAVFLDLGKAFDTVNHSVLLTKLSKFNFSNNTVSWIESYLHDRRQTVSINNCGSGSLKLTSGVPQVSILGPLLFSLYINDLPSVCPEAECIMYADDTVFFVHGRSKTAVTAKFAKAMSCVGSWLQESCLELNISKTVGMYFSKTNRASPDPDIEINGEKIEIVSHFKYLGLTIDSQLSFKTHIEKLCKKIKFNLLNYRSIRNEMSLEAAKMFLHSMIFSHFNDCITSWSQAGQSVKKPLEVLYKQAVKVLDKKPRHYHHCAVFKKHSLLNWDNLHKFMDIRLMFKVLHNLAPDPLSVFVNRRKDSERVTRGSVRGDCLIPLRRSAFSQSAWSVRSAAEWNSVPEEIRQSTTCKDFTKKLKKYLTDTYRCRH
uniref:Reverse transcriptase domain-containing protein n=1 Tax=Oryzias melastigma TaxID=30732 RepID=A0A3B3BZN4_ORYME